MVYSSVLTRDPGSMTERRMGSISHSLEFAAGLPIMDVSAKGHGHAPRDIHIEIQLGGNLAVG